MPAATLVPGYKHVESFGPDEDYIEGEEEVSYVALDLGVVEPTLLPSTSTYRLIGLDTPTPFLQLSGSIFKGRHDALLGTELLFTDDKSDLQPNKRSLTHVGCAEQRIRFRQVQLERKAPPEPTPPEPERSLLEEVASMYVDAEENETAAAQAAPGPSGDSEARRLEPASPRKRKRSKKGKERATEEDEDDATIDTI